MSKYLSRGARAFEAQREIVDIIEYLESLKPEDYNQNKEQTLYKVIITKEICDKFDDVTNEVESLQSEMQDWVDNMSGTNLENTTKYSTVEDTATDLDIVLNDLNDVDIIPDKEYDLEDVQSWIVILSNIHLETLEFPGMYE